MVACDNTINKAIIIFLLFQLVNCTFVLPVNCSFFLFPVAVAIHWLLILNNIQLQCCSQCEFTVLLPSQFCFCQHVLIVSFWHQLVFLTPLHFAAFPMPFCLTWIGLIITIYHCYCQLLKPLELILPTPCLRTPLLAAAVPSMPTECYFWIIANFNVLFALTSLLCTAFPFLLCLIWIAAFCHQLFVAFLLFAVTSLLKLPVMTLPTQLFAIGSPSVPIGFWIILNFNILFALHKALLPCCSFFIWPGSLLADCCHFIICCCQYKKLPALLLSIALLSSLIDIYFLIIFSVTLLLLYYCLLLHCTLVLALVDYFFWHPSGQTLHTCDDVQH